MYSPNQLKSTLIFLLVIGIVAISLISFQPRGSPSIQISRRMGFILGEKFQGKMTLTAQLGSDIDELKLYFDNELQSTAVANSLSYEFDTNEFPLGDVSITIKGFKNQTLRDSYTRKIEFIPLQQSIIYFISISTIIIGLIAIFLTSNRLI
ncbi:hypothetical protein WKT22_03832 [Candidatus Lokiarchaeum ossiferum]